MRRAVRDGELDPVEAGVLARRLLVAAARERLGRLQLLVGLGHLHAAAEDLVGHGVAREVAHLAGLHGERDGGVAGVVALGRSGLDDAIIACGKCVGAGRGDVRSVLGRGLDRGADLSVGVYLPPTSTYRPVSLTTEKLAPSSEASPWGSAPASESSSATLTPPADQLKLTSVCEPPPVLDAERLEPGGDPAGARLHLWRRSRRSARISPRRRTRRSCRAWQPTRTQSRRRR